MDANIDNDETGVQVYINNEAKKQGIPRWPAFEKSIDDAASKGLTCFVDFDDEKAQKCKNNAAEGDEELPWFNNANEDTVRGEARETDDVSTKHNSEVNRNKYDNYKAFIRKHKSDFEKLVRKHDLMCVYLDKRVFLVPTRFLKNKNEKDTNEAIQQMIKPIVNYWNQKKYNKSFIYTHGTSHYDPFECGFCDPDDRIPHLDNFPFNGMYFICTNNHDGPMASIHGMQQRGKRQGQVMNKLFSDITNQKTPSIGHKKHGLMINGDSFGNVVNNVVLDELLNKEDSVLKPDEKTQESIMDCKYWISKPYFSYPFTPSYEYNYSSLIKHKLPKNFIIEEPRVSDCCLDPIHPKCIVNEYKRIFENNDNTRDNCEWIQEEALKNNDKDIKNDVTRSLNNDNQNVTISK